jgi:FAD binding domain
MWWSNLWREKELTEEELKDLSIETVKQEMLSTYYGYHQPIPMLIAHTGPPVKLNVYDILELPAWHKGRVVVIGDAAHAVSPNAGQGASMALEDAMYMAKVLRDSREIMSSHSSASASRVSNASSPKAGAGAVTRRVSRRLGQRCEMQCSRFSSICLANETRTGFIGTESNGENERRPPDRIRIGTHIHAREAIARIRTPLVRTLHNPGVTP